MEQTLTEKQMEALCRAAESGGDIEAALAEMKISGGARQKMLWALSARGMIDFGAGGVPYLTEAARKQVDARKTPQNGAEWRQQLAELTGEEPKPIEMPKPEERPHAASARLAREHTKQALMIELLRRPEGASIDQIAEATGWQRHSVRGVLSRAIKKELGLNLVSEKPQGGQRIYRIAI